MNAKNNEIPILDIRKTNIYMNIRKFLSFPMKKHILMLMMIALSSNAYAQWKIGRPVRSVDYYNLTLEEDSYYIYSENGNGSITVYVLAYDLSANEWMMGLSPVNANMEFSGYYYGQVTDPKDDYVNVRKGPGTNFPVVDKLYVDDFVCVKKTDGGWLKVYECERNNAESLSGSFSFKGYVYKDRVKTPEHEDETIEERKQPVVVKEWRCADDNHPHAIDLGIGTKWACCNIDATSPLDIGGYYAWGETKTKDYFGFGNHLASDIETDIANTTLDVAHVKWGDRWRIPSGEQIQELKEKCKYQWAIINGVIGGMFTGPNGNSIFLPAAGRRNGKDLEYLGEKGFYNGSSYFVLNINFDSNYCEPMLMGEQLGCPVRPVLK